MIWVTVMPLGLTMPKEIKYLLGGLIILLIGFAVQLFKDREYWDLLILILIIMGFIFIMNG